MSTSYDGIIREASQQTRISVFQFSKTYPAFVTLLTGILFSFILWNIVDNKVRSDRDMAFEKATGSVVGRLQTGIDQNMQVLNSIDGLYKNSVQVVRDMFELYGSIPTRTNSSILSMYYVPYVAQAAKDQFIYYAQSERYYDFKITPTGTRPYYLPIEYVVPLTQISQRSGFDFSTIPEADSTIKRAMEAKGSVVASPFYFVRPDTLGFLMAFKVENKPAEQQSILGIPSGRSDGFAVLEIDALKFFEKAIGANVASDTSIVFEILDAATNKPIYASSNASLLKTGYTPILAGQQHVTFADRKVLAKFHTVPNFGGSFQAMLPMLSLGASLVLSFAAFGFVLSITTSRARAIDLADRLTRSQRRIIEASKDIIAVLDLNGAWKSFSPATEQILHFDGNDLVGKNIAHIFTNPKDSEAFSKKITEMADESGISYDVQMNTREGDTRWLSWHFTVSKADGNIYATGRDITLQKIAEEQIRLKNRQVQLAEQQALDASEFKSRFMRDLSHKLRNNLTGTLGFLQLLSGKMYDSDMEEQSYIEQAESSSDQLFSVVTDIIDVADEADAKTQEHKDRVVVEDGLRELQQLLSELGNDRQIQLKSEIESKGIMVLGEEATFVGCLFEICKALAPNEGQSVMQIFARANTHEKVAEIELMAPHNAVVTRLIAIYKRESNNLVEALVHDQNDVLFHIGLAISSVRRLNGTITIDSLGEGSENVCLLTIPLAKPKKLASAHS